MGSVRASGPAGVGRSDPMAYDPPGYNPVFATWEIDALQNRAEVVVDAPSDTALENPTFVVHGYVASSGTAPELRLDGARLVADRDYFASVRADTHELWITLNGKLRGAGHRLAL